MDSRIAFESMIRLAVSELDYREYEDFVQKKNRNNLDFPGPQVDAGIDRIIAKEERKGRRKIMVRILSKAAVCFAIVFSCLSGTFLTARAVRESVATVAMEWHEKFTRTIITSDNVAAKLPQIELGYIPDGYVTDESTFNYTGFYYNMLLSENNYIEITILPSETNGAFDTDNEHNNYYTVIINDKKALWLYDNIQNKLLVSNNGLTFYLRGTVPLNELIKIYENIKIL